MRVIDLFAGPGGWSEGLRVARQGCDDVRGVEIDVDARLTAEAAGHVRISGDVSLLPPRDIFADTGGCDYIHASPPCQGFSLAGNGHGRRDGDALVRAITSLHGDPLRTGAVIRDSSLAAHDPRSPLTLEPLRWIADLMPAYVTLEQVPSVLPVWQAYARTLESWGYSAWTGCLHAEAYGVPQARRRAILMARRDGHVASPPPPIRSRYNTRSPGSMDEGLERWVSLGEAFESAGLPPSSWMASGTRPNASIRTFDQPSVTLAFGNDSASFVLGSGDVSGPGQIARLKAEGKVRRITPMEAGVLQGFPVHYPWQGSRTSQLRQVGNAVPPPLASAIVGHLLAAAT